MTNLFDISNKYYLLLKQLEDTIDLMGEDDTLEDVAGDTIKELEISESEAKDKIEAYYYFIKQQEGNIQLLKDEQQRLANKVKSKENLIQRLKDRVNDALKLFGEQSKTGNYKLKTDKLSVWNVFHKPVKLDENFYNNNYMRFKIRQPFYHDEIIKLQEYLKAHGITLDLDSAPDMTLIKEDLKAGVEIPGAKLDTDASYVRFK